MRYQDMRGATIQILCFGVVASILYLLGYWSTFGIIIFEYANFKDIIIASMILVSTGLVLALIGFTLSALFLPYEEPNKYEEPEDYEKLELEELLHRLKETRRKLKETRRKLKEIGETRMGRFFLWSYKTKIGQSLLKQDSPITKVIVIFYGIVLTIIGFASFPFKTLIFGSLCSLAGFLAVYNSGFLSDIKHPKVRAVLIYILFFGISAAYFLGKDRAEVILNDGPKTVYEVGSGRKYLGHTNGYFFLLSPDNSKVTVIRAKSHGDLVLTRNVSKALQKNNDETQNLPTESETGPTKEEARNAERGGNSHPNVKKK